MNESMNSCMNHKCLRCLVVEDNFFAADVMSIYFQRNNIDCDIAENGEMGLNMYLENPLSYSVIFCDLQMPVMDGYEMIKLIRASGLPTALTIPIVAMSGTITGTSVGENSFSFFLKKPYDLNYLPLLIDNLLNGHTPL